MNSEKYIGLDVHQTTISVAVMDSKGKVVMESILEMKAATILEFFAGLRGTLAVEKALLKPGNKSDRIDARNSPTFCVSMIWEPVYHGETGWGACGNPIASLTR